MQKNIYDTLRKLVEWTAPPETPVLSLYLDISKGQCEETLEYVRVRCLELEQHAWVVKSPAFLQSMRRFLRDVPSTIERSRQQDYDGIALFYSAKPPLQAEVCLRFPFENQALVGRDPFLRHLLAYAEEYEKCVCAVFTESGAQVCEIHVGDNVNTRQVHPSQRRDLASQLNALLTRMVREDPTLHVMLFAEPGLRDAVEGQLSQDVVARIIDRLDHPLEATQPEFLLAVQRLLQDYERRTEAAGVHQLLQLRRQGENVAVGLAETLQTINQGRIRVLYVLQSFSDRGWLCDVCDYLGALPDPPGCLACGASVSLVPLNEHILDQAAACGAEIETVYESDDLQDVGGIGALID